MGMDVPARVEAHAAGHTDGALNVCVGETYAPRRQSIQVRGLNQGMAGAGKAIRPHLVGHDEEDIGFFAHGGSFFFQSFASISIWA
jgi:hypothetical protein